MIAYSIILVKILFTSNEVLLILLINLAFYFIVALFASKIAVWVLSVMSLYLVNTSITYLYTNKVQNDLSRDEVVEFVVLIYFMNLRAISFLIDKLSCKNDDEIFRRKYNFVKFLSYVLYPTFIFTAPFVPHKNFLSCLETRESSIPIRKIFATYLPRILISIVLVEGFLHMTSIYAINENLINISNHFSVTSVSLSILLKICLFTCKYIVYYGLTSMINLIVGMKCTDMPRSLLITNTNRELWKYFDTGIYEFIKNYLYIPFGGSKQSKHSHFLSLIVSFGYVCFWHGLYKNVLIWCVVNFSMVLAENSILKRLCYYIQVKI